jgi:hypothetical protein
MNEAATLKLPPPRLSLSTIWAPIYSERLTKRQAHTIIVLVVRLNAFNASEGDTPPVEEAP